jgi:hypothetical protein
VLRIIEVDDQEAHLASAISRSFRPSRRIAGRQVRASNPVDNPPDDRMRMPAVSQESRLCTRRAQASEQEWQPMHRFILGVVNIFISHLLKDKDFSSIVRSLYRSLPFF